MARYLGFMGFAVAMLFIVVAGVNWVVDPYGVYRDYSLDDWKPHAATQGALVKPYQVLRAAPRTLVLGNSRAEVGFDPQDAAWLASEQPVYNLALPGTGVRAARRLLEHTVSRHAIKRVVLGVDFMDFLVQPSGQFLEPELSGRLLLAPDGGLNTYRRLSMLKDGASTLISLDALIHSLDTLRQHQKSGVAHLTSSGFNPMHDYGRMARADGYYALFRQRDVENLQAYQQRPRHLFHAGTATSPPLDDVAAIMQLAKQHGIQIDLVIYPYHAHLLEIFQLSGLWNVFEDWKRALVIRVESVGDARVNLWDFSGYHPYATEAVPAPGDRTTAVRWYWEAGHFKAALGHQVLDQLKTPDSNGFGIKLTPDNLEAQLERQREAGAIYRASPSAALAELIATSR
ncbi:MAG: hypothetical protein ABL877_07685 [Thiobacillus sp.]